MAQRCDSTVVLALNFDEQRLAISARVTPLTRGLVAILCRPSAVFGGHLAQLGGSRSLLYGALASHRRA